MITEIKSKCYTCLDPIAPPNPIDSAGPVGRQRTDLDH